RLQRPHLRRPEARRAAGVFLGSVAPAIRLLGRHEGVAEQGERDEVPGVHLTRRAAGGVRGSDLLRTGQPEGLRSRSGRDAFDPARVAGARQEPVVPGLFVVEQGRRRWPDELGPGTGALRHDALAITLLQRPPAGGPRGRLPFTRHRSRRWRGSMKKYPGTTPAKPGIFQGEIEFSNPTLRDYRWPVCEIAGRRAGPKLCVTAGVHVNEVSSIEAAIRLQRL